LGVISEIYNEKITHDIVNSKDSFQKINLDLFLLKFYNDKYKINEIIETNLEQVLLSVLKNRSDDDRIRNFYRFLSLESKGGLSKEILEYYLITLKALPFSFFKLFKLEMSEINIPIESCLDIFTATKLKYFELSTILLRKLVSNTYYTSNGKSLNSLSYKKKLEVLLLNRFYTNQTSLSLFNKLSNKYKEGEKTSNIEEILDRFLLINKDFNFTKKQVIEILKNNFEVEDNEVNLEQFIHFFVDKKSLLIKAEVFINLVLEELNTIFNDLVAALTKCFLKEDTELSNMISFKNFEKAIQSLIKLDTNNKYKVSSYFK